MIVLGHSLNALCFSYSEGIPLYSSGIRPHEFDENLPLWNRLATHLSFRGLFPCLGNIDTLRIEDDTLAVVTTDNAVVRVPYEHVYVFNDNKVSGLPPPVGKVDKELLVLDYFDLRFVEPHNHEVILDKEYDLVSKILFYNNMKGKRQHSPNKDICCFTKLKESQLYDTEFSEAYARLKTKRMLKEADILGSKNGMDYKKNIQKRRAIQLEWMGRHTHELTSQTYESTDTTTFPVDNYLDKARKKIYNDSVEKLLGSPFEEEELREPHGWDNPAE